MAYIQYLNFNGENLPLPTSYSMTLNDVEADSSGETEAGTTQRCINTMNKLTGDFFDYALKGKEKPEIEKEY